MAPYDFQCLSPIDFEQLVCDLLTADHGFRYEIFGLGRDGGIDLRGWQSVDEQTIVQCKHWPNASFRTILNHLVKRELPKIILQRPKRYILALSMSLTPGNKRKMMQALAPWIQSPSDILGRDDLNSLLRLHPEVERHTMKLWMSSVHVLEELIHSKIVNFSKFELERIRDRAKLYVRNQSFYEAARILDAECCCIIAGPPGIGKTTLAEMLLLHYAENGYELVKISSDISEAYSMYQPGRKRVYYYDDFLGQTSLAEKMNKNEDARLMDFVNMITSSSDSKFILTTREYILNQAKERYEKIDRIEYYIQRYTLEISKYNRYMRAMILFNHIWFSDLPSNFIGRIVVGNLPKWIVCHPNFNPRLIEFMMHPARYSGCTSSEYIGKFIDVLKKPEEVWRHPFLFQISSAARDFLLVLFTLPSSVHVSNVKCAFERLRSSGYGRIDSIVSGRDFEAALEELDGDFIRTDLSYGESRLKVGFSNPSIRDFIQCYLDSNPDIDALLYERSYYYDQVESYWNRNPRYFKDCDESLITSRSVEQLIKILIRVLRLSDKEEYEIVENANGLLTFEQAVFSCLQLLEELKIEVQYEFVLSMLVKLEMIVDDEDRIIGDMFICEFIEHLIDKRYISMDNHSGFLEKFKRRLIFEIHNPENIHICLCLDGVVDGLFTDEDIQHLKDILPKIVWDLPDNVIVLNADGAREFTRLSRDLGRFLKVPLGKELRRLHRWTKKEECRDSRPVDDEIDSHCSDVIEEFPIDIDSLFQLLDMRK